MMFFVTLQVLFYFLFFFTIVIREVACDDLMFVFLVVFFAIGSLFVCLNMLSAMWAFHMVKPCRLEGCRCM